MNKHVSKVDPHDTGHSEYAYDIGHGEVLAKTARTHACSNDLFRCECVRARVFYLKVADSLLSPPMCKVMEAFLWKELFLSGPLQAIPVTALITTITRSP